MGLKELIENGCFAIILNCNDTFSYATSDEVRVDSADVPKLLDMYERFGNDGLNAFASKVKKKEVIKQKQTNNYKAAREVLKDYEFIGECY